MLSRGPLGLFSSTSCHWIALSLSSPNPWDTERAILHPVKLDLVGQLPQVAERPNELRIRWVLFINSKPGLTKNSGQLSEREQEELGSILEGKMMDQSYRQSCLGNSRRNR